MRLRDYQLLALVCIALCFTACQKDLIEVPASSEGTPVFSTSNAIDGLAFDLTAGFDDYYMHTSYSKDAADVYTFIGNFALEDCAEDCASSIQFEIRNNQSGSTNDINNALGRGKYRIKNAEIAEMDVYQVQFEGSTTEANPSELFWNFGDEDGMVLFGQKNPLFNYIDNGTPKQPIFRVNSNDQLYSTLTRTVDFNNPNAAECLIAYEVIPQADGRLELRSNIDPLTDLVFWDNGDYGASTFLDPNEITETTEMGVTGLYSDGCYSVASRTFVPNGNGTLSYMSDGGTGFDYVVKKIAGGSLLHFSTFAVQYIDDNGTVFRSDYFQQPNNESSFEILEVEDYSENAAGEKTKKLTIKYNCYVYTESGDQFLRLTNGSAIIAVAHP